jgi:dihydroorotate dehydrogenase
MYRLIRSILFLLPAETAHYVSMNFLRFFSAIGLRPLISALYTPKNNGYSWEMMGLRFRNPVGLGAGFDKNAKYLRELEALGFGFVEIGTVTPVAQSGNAKPRLFRLANDGALINRMGFNNEGVKLIASRLKNWKDKTGDKKNRMIIGGNIGKNKVTPNEDAWKDYEICFRELHPFVDYFVVNVSSPNTPGLRELQEKESLGKILRHLQMINNGKAVSKPIFLKIAPDLTEAQVNDVIELATEINLDGLVVANTTISRDGLSEISLKHDKEPGGLSGRPLLKKSTDMLRYISEATNGSLPLIGSGGIFNSKDAAEKLAAGASLIQVWTGFIYEGPGIVKKITNKLNARTTIPV